MGLLCEDLSVKNSFPAPHTFGRARKMLVDNDRDVKKCLIEGFLSEKLRFFPDINLTDIRGSRKIFWNCRNYVVLESEGQNVRLSQVANATLKVCTEVECRSLSYSRNLEKYRDHGMLWMEAVLQKLPQRIKGTEHLNVLTFVSCIGMIMNGDYVEYNQLRNLLDELSPSISQALLQQWQILSQFHLPKVLNFIVWKLKEDIPFRVQVAVKPKPFKVREEAVQEQPFEDVQEVEDQDGMQPMSRSKPRTLPAGGWQSWSAAGEENITIDKSVSSKDAYNMYVCKCHEEDIPVRTRNAFRQKRTQLMNNED